MLEEQTESLLEVSCSTLVIVVTEASSSGAAAEITVPAETVFEDLNENLII